MFRWTGGSVSTLGRRLPKKIDMHHEEKRKRIAKSNNSVDFITGAISQNRTRALPRKLNITNDMEKKIKDDIKMLCDSKDEEFDINLNMLDSSFLAEDGFEKIIHIKKKEKEILPVNNENKELSFENAVVANIKPDRKDSSTQA